MNLILCGYQGCGKTTIGQKFCEQNNYDFIDTDQLICQQQQQTCIKAIHKTLGEHEFRDVENKVIHAINTSNNTLIATGGGAVVKPSNVKRLKELGKIIYLYLEPNAIYSRILQRGALPHIFRKSTLQQDFKRYIDSRKTLYQSIADHIIDTTNRSVDDVVRLIQELLRDSHGK